jgi:hypothetical protein
MALTPPPTAPSSSSPSTFEARADALVAWFATFVSEANILAAAMDAAAAGGVFSLGYTFSTTTTDADPGAGYLRLNNATQNAATVLRVDLTDLSGNDQTNALDLFNDSTSAICGFIKLFKFSDPTKYLIFSVTSVASPSGYRNVTGACVAYSAASPFSNGDQIELEFTRTGDKGDTGPAANLASPGPIGGTTPAAIAGTTGTFSGSLATTGTNKIHPGNDANYYSYFDGTNPLTFFDANDSTYYDRAGNYYVWRIGGSVIGLLSATGLNQTPVGANTPSTGAFTTLSATGTITATATAGMILKRNTAGAGENYIDFYNGATQAAELDFYSSATDDAGLKLYTKASGGGIAVSLDVFGSGAVYFPRIGTTASAANAYLDGSNGLLKSTSSLRYKKDAEPVSLEYANKIWDIAEKAIFYRSKASSDNPAWSFWGLGAEDLAEIDPRLVHWSYPIVGEEIEEIEREEVVLETREVDTIEVRDGKAVVLKTTSKVPVIEMLPMVDEQGLPIMEIGSDDELVQKFYSHTKTKKTITRRTKPVMGTELVPDGVQYERLAVLLMVAAKARFEKLEK